MSIILYPPNSPIMTHFFNIPIRYYGVIMATCFLVGIIGVYHLFKFSKKHEDAEFFLDYSPVLIFFSLIGARLFYVLGSWTFYLNNPKEIFMINHGGISVMGAIFAGLSVLYITSKKKKINYFLHCDMITLIFPLCQSIGRIGNYFNQEAFGMPTDGFVKLFVDVKNRPAAFLANEFYHPAFLYEMFFDILIFLFLMIVFFKFKNLKSGTILFLYLILYSFVRFFVELIRVDSVLNIGQVPVVCIICVLLFIVSLICLVFLYKKDTH